MPKRKQENPKQTNTQTYKNYLWILEQADTIQVGPQSFMVKESWKVDNLGKVYSPCAILAYFHLELAHKNNQVFTNKKQIMS